MLAASVCCTWCLSEPSTQSSAKPAVYNGPKEEHRRFAGTNKEGPGPGSVRRPNPGSRKEERERGGNRTVVTPCRKPHNRWVAHVAGGLRTPPMPGRRRERERERRGKVPRSVETPKPASYEHIGGAGRANGRAPRRGFACELCPWELKETERERERERVRERDRERERGRDREPAPGNAMHARTYYPLA